MPPFHKYVNKMNKVATTYLGSDSSLIKASTLDGNRVAYSPVSILNTSREI